MDFPNAGIFERYKSDKPCNGEILTGQKIVLEYHIIHNPISIIIHLQLKMNAQWMPNEFPEKKLHEMKVYMN